MNYQEFFQDKDGSLSSGRLCQILGIVCGFAYIMIHPSDGNFSTYMMACGGAFLVSKGGDVLSPAFNKGKSDDVPA